MLILNTTVMACSLFFGVPAVEAPAVNLVAVAADEVSGVVKSANVDEKTFTVALESGEERQVTWNDTTVFMLDGEKSDAKAVLVTNGKVRATLSEEGVATSVSRWSE